MKKNLFFSLVVCMSLAGCPFYSHAAGISVSSTSHISTPPLTAPEADALVQRLNEINAMDKSALSRNEKKMLRHEVRSINERLHDNGGIYISVGALIIIILLLIILL